MYTPDKISVSEGSSFSITCSIHSQYSGGLFLLRKSNQNITEPKPAFGHALFFVATFDFSVINYKDQGDYDCLYTVNISSLLFNSVPSKTLQITVAGQFIFLEYLQHRLSLHMLTQVSLKPYSGFILLGYLWGCVWIFVGATCSGSRFVHLEKEEQGCW